MKRAIEGMAEAGEELIQKAIDANRRFQEAESNGEPAEEIERHRVMAQLLYRMVTEQQLITCGKAPYILH